MVMMQQVSVQEIKSFRGQYIRMRYEIDWMNYEVMALRQNRPGSSVCGSDIVVRPEKKSDGCADAPTRRALHMTPKPQGHDIRDAIGQNEESRRLGEQNAHRRDEHRTGERP